MEEFKVIEFQQTRDFSRKLNSTFEFLRQNFKSMGKSILYISGPSVLVASLLIGSFMGEFLSLTQSLQSQAGNAESLGNYFLTVSFWAQVLAMLIFFFISFVVTIATINCYINLYIEKRTNKIEVQEVWDRVRIMFWNYAGTTILFFLTYIVVIIVLVIPMVILGAISPILIFFGVIFLFVGLFYLVISVSLTFFVQAQEKVSFIAAMVRSYRLVNNGKWWSTFGLLFILQMITGISSYIFLMPYYIIVFSASMHTVSTGTPFEMSNTMITITTVCFTLYYMAQMLLYSLPHVGIAFQYFNLVELKEARGLMSQIETIGQPSADPNRPEETY
jgi:hypothetical protein